MDNRTNFFIAAPFILIAFAFFAAGFVKFKPKLSPAELRMQQFAPEVKGLREKQPFDSVVLSGPFEINNKARQGSSSLKPVSDNKVSEINVSMIVLNDNKLMAMAIVNGRVVREGDVIDMIKILRIEREKVLLSYHADGENIMQTKWVSVKGVK